jgi:hypothetical protein
VVTAAAHARDWVSACQADLSADPKTLGPKGDGAFGVPSITGYEQILEAAVDKVPPELPVVVGIAEMVDYNNISVRRSFNGEDSSTDHGRSGARLS